MKTYIALADFAVEQTPVPKGTMIGTGDIDAGKFSPSKGFEVIEVGHVQGRFGHLVGLKENEPAKQEEKPQPDKPKRGRPKAKKSINPEG